MTSLTKGETSFVPRKNKEVSKESGMVDINEIVGWVCDGGPGAPSTGGWSNKAKGYEVRSTSMKSERGKTGWGGEFKWLP